MVRIESDSMASFPYYLANRPEQPNTDLEVTDKYSGEIAYRVAMADVAAIDRAIGAAVDAAEPMRRMAPYELDVGGVIIGDVPSWRVDNMPYVGVKDSGLGREGVRFAMEDMTEIRNLVIRTPGR